MLSGTCGTKDMAGLARERQQRQQVEQQEQPLPLDIQEHIDSFQEKHPWWNSKGRDKDSKVVLRLDNEIAEEGYDPAEPEYWEELERRVREELPHRFSGENGAREQRSPRVGAGSTEAGTRKLNKNYVKITPERKQAMIDAGAWDDPDKRKRMLKRYRDYDVAHATDRRA